ncbi:MAG TPA: hypothetical protein VGW39_11860 [Chthoniobacterales bacterium]|nr:hypothetical protein [Chthoniobacterales bacterium]
MKILLVISVSVFALLLGGCETSRPLIPDEEYETYRGPAPHSPDPMRNVPQNRTRMSGGY